jgi:hypothetical protein
MPDIFVTNGNAFAHVDFYNGVAYEFPPGERVAVPDQAARHMLAYQDPDKDTVLHRLGWAGTMARLPDGRSEWVPDDSGAKKLAKFRFTKAMLVEAPEPEAAPLA